MTWLKIGHLVKFFNVRISKNCQKLEFNLGHLGTGGKLYFHEYLQKKNRKIQTPCNSSIFCVSHPHCKG